MKQTGLLLICLMLWAGAPAFAGTTAVPMARIESPEFQFDPVMDGDIVEHIFRMTNTGTVPLEILKIDSG